MSIKGYYMPAPDEKQKASIGDVLGVVEQWISEASDIESEIAELQAQLKEHKSQMSEWIRNELQCTAVNMAKTVATVLYWRFDDVSVRRGIAAGLGLAGNAPLRNYVYPALAQAPCVTCGNPADVSVASMSEAHGGKRALCDDCKNKEIEQRAQIELARAERNEVARQAMQALKTMPYPDYLKTDHWQDLRKRSLKRAGYRCQTCNAKGVLHVHHRTYVRRGEEELSDLIVLCANCHSTFHNAHEVTNE